MSEKELLDKIAQMLREAYPDAAAVKVFVNDHEVEVEKRYVKPDGFSMKSLNGKWIK